MKRMTEEKANELFDAVKNAVDLDNIPMDDKQVFELFGRGDTDGVYMMETEWDKYDLRQIRPKNIEELTACLALSHDTRINPYIYTYIKLQHITQYTFELWRFTPVMEEILSETYGMLLYKEQVDAIRAHLESMTDEEKFKYEMPINIINNEIERRKGTISNRAFFRKRALLCYKIAYIKVYYKNIFDDISNKK